MNEFIFEYTCLRCGFKFKSNISNEPHCKKCGVRFGGPKIKDSETVADDILSHLEEDLAYADHSDSW